MHPQYPNDVHKSHLNTSSKDDNKNEHERAVALAVNTSRGSSSNSSTSHTLPLDLSFAFSLNSEASHTRPILNPFETNDSQSESMVPPSIPTTPATSAPLPSISLSSQTNVFKYAVYQPPPTKDQQQDASSSSPTYFRLGDHHHHLEPEQISSGTSTLVGSPMTPRFESQGQAPWLPRRNSQNQQSSRLSPTTGSVNPFEQDESSALGISAFNSSMIGRRKDIGTPRRFSQSADEFDNNSLVGHASAAKSLGYQGDHPRQFLSVQTKSNNNASSWEPHIAVMMDDISLESFTGDSPSKKDSSKRGLYSLDGASQSNLGMSSNASMVTLLGKNSCSSAKSSSSSSTLFGGFLQKSKNNTNFNKLPDEQPDQHQTISMSTGGKEYTKRPKAKKFGAKKGGEGGSGGNGDGVRKALFSNERTFIQWIRFGIIIGTLALTLCNFGQVGTLAFYVGSSILMVAMSSLGYAAILFHRRDRSLTRRLDRKLGKKQPKRNGVTTSGVAPPKVEDEICYYDRVGPTILCSILFVAFSINFCSKLYNLSKKKK
ncbi:vacuolar transporter chaperone [Entomortierella beljakovae]|nr:vacuolar transporter chaperone [Entomortierella beljakovae]